jgi:hypothetical protein
MFDFTNPSSERIAKIRFDFTSLQVSIALTRIGWENVVHQTLVSRLDSLTAAQFSATTCTKNNKNIERFSIELSGRFLEFSSLNSSRKCRLVTYLTFCWIIKVFHGVLNCYLLIFICEVFFQYTERV